MSSAFEDRNMSPLEQEPLVESSLGRELIVPFRHQWLQGAKAGSYYDVPLAMSVHRFLQFGCTRTVPAKIVRFASQ